ncbi:uncharacterized protein LOC131689975 [Topomyia yanbarensis]|uniref:uncharacterized protein LOC131689975 n=1 Tax=Topomyia yanbarensis TaxID=2498891 RepID=UPI00273BFDBC|nr:uncharacterized protein LOC131689975 [Topomyia yanbarensis]
MTTPPMKRKSISGEDCPFSAKKTKTETGQKSSSTNIERKSKKKLKLKKPTSKKNVAFRGDKKNTAKRISTGDGINGNEDSCDKFTTSSNKVVENFRQKLNQGSVAADVIRHFAQSMQHNPSYAVDFIRAGGTFKPLMKILDTLSAEKLSEIADLFQLIHYILIESVNYDKTHADYAAKCAKTIFLDHKPSIVALLKGQTNEQLLIAGFRILKAILLIDHSYGKEILRLLDVCLPEMEMKRYRETSASGFVESLRGVFVDFNLCFLVDTGSELVRGWLSRFQLLSPLVINLVYDRAENVILVMKTFKKYILEAPDIDKYIYRTTFSTDILKALVNVYEWVGPSGEDVDAELKGMVLNATEKLVLPLLTSKKYHLVPKVVDLSRGVSRQKHILLALKNSQLHEHQRKLVLKIFETCPEVLPAVLENFGLLLKTKNQEHRIFLLDILRLLKPEEIVKNFCTADAKHVSNFVTKSTLPRTILEYVTTSINRKVAAPFCFEFLAVMLSQCEKYLQEVPKLKNLDQFDIKKIRFDVLNQILGLFPTIDAIMGLMMHHQSDKKVFKPYIAMEHAMDILLACIRTFPSYIESSSFITTYRNILNPVHRQQGNEHEYLAYEFKAIKVVIALEPQSIAFNSELFPSVLKLLAKVYLNGSPEMQRKSTTQLLTLFRNTTLFGNNPTEIEIWFQSLHASPALVPELVSFLASTVRLAAKQQNLPKQNDHSLINEAFEKIQRSDLDELFHSVEAEASGQLEQELPVELPVADNFLIYMFHPNTTKPKHFYPYLEAVALRYFHLLPHPEIVQHCTKDVGGKMHKYFTKWIVEGKAKPLDGFGEQSSLGRLSRLLLQQEQALQEVLPDGTSNRCELVYLIHETIFYATRLIEMGKFDSVYSMVCSFYLNSFFDLLREKETDLNDEDRKMGELLKNIFCHRPVLFQYFTVTRRKGEKSDNEMNVTVTNFIYELMKNLQSIPNFSQHTALYSNKIVNEIITASSPHTRDGSELDSKLVDKLLEIFQLNERHCVSLLKHYSQLSHREFVNDKNEKTYNFNLLTIGLKKLAGNKDFFVEQDTMERLSKIYIDLIRENGNELNLDSLDEAMLSYLETFSHNIGHMKQDIFRCFFESKRIGKPMVKLATFLLARGTGFDSILLEMITANISKKELVYPLINVAVQKNIFKDGNDDHKKLLAAAYNEFKSGINKTIEKPGKAAVIYKENTFANQYLIRNCMPKNECVDFAKKKIKIDSLEVYQLKLMMEIYRNAFETTKTDPTQVKILYLNVFGVLLQFYNVLLKVADLFKDIEKLNELVTATFTWVKFSKKCNHLAATDYKELTETANWTNFCKFSLKLGIDIHKSPDNPNRHDERLHVLLQIAAMLVDLFYKDNGSAAEIVNFYELALSHSRFLNVLLVPFQFKVKTSLVHLMLMLARKNHSVMDKKHIPILLGSYGATLTDGNRYILALIQHYERSGIHMHEYRPFLWGDAAIKKFSLGQDATEQQSLVRIYNTEVFSLLNREMLINTMNNFPVWRKLDAGMQLPDVSFDDLSRNDYVLGKYTPVTEIERFVESGCHRKRKATVEMLEHCTSKREVAARIYDPTFLLPLLGYLFAPENYDMLDWAGKCGALAIPFVCLASVDAQMRLAAGSVVLRIKGHLEQSRKFIDSPFWLHLFTSVQNGLAALGRSKSSTSSEPPDFTKRKLPKPAFLPSLFIGQMVNILPDVLNVLHSTLTHYFLLKDTFDFKAVPNFLVMFHSSDVQHNSHRVFILETICNGIKTHDDFMILRVSPVIRALIDFYGCALSNRDLNILILNILNSIVKIPKSCEVMINAIGFFTWISERIEGIESFHFDTIEAFLGILSNAWYSVQIQRQHYNMKQISRVVLIMVLKFIPLLSTRSSSKTLTRFLNLLEKTVEENETNIKLVTGEVLELMLVYFEKLFEPQFWHVQYVKSNGSENCEQCQSLGSKLLAQDVDESTICIILTLRRFVIRWQKAQLVCSVKPQ